MKTQKQTRIIELYWRYGKKQVITGPDMGDRFETVGNAMNKAGIGAGALFGFDAGMDEE